MKKKSEANVKETANRCCLRRSVRLLQLRYTRTVKIGNAWNTYLQINHQGFCVVEQTSKHRALWFGKNLAIALDRMLTHFEPSPSFPISNRKTKCQPSAEYALWMFDCYDTNHDEDGNCVGESWPGYVTFDAWKKRRKAA